MDNREPPPLPRMRETPSPQIKTETEPRRTDGGFTLYKSDHKKGKLSYFCGNIAPSRMLERL